MTVSTSTLFCIVCGREFRPRDADTVICPDCGGPPEAPAPSQPQGTALADQPRGTVLMSQPAYQRMCILCGQDFTTPDPQADRCPQCRGEAPHPQPEIRSRPESRQRTPAMPAPAQGTVAMPESGMSPAPSSADVPLTWNAGDVILDLYEVKGELGKGGMGVVYRVHHRQWNIDLAVKTPLPEALQKAGSLENFLREAQAWVDLGLHPHIVTCYYVRRLGEMPRVFAECMEGGSLKNWMEDGRLYAGGEQEALKRILDCAIQFAWGLGYAHEKGLVHQDVKPANALMTPDGMLKVTDFGLVGAKGYTPAYAAPEQELGQAVSPRTDIWGWGVSVLEMFTGGVHWQFGSVAASVLENYLQEAPPEGIPPMPAALAELLRQCFQDDPEQRPASMDEVAERLMRLYEQETGSPYPRPKPQALDMRADSLNNKAVSLLDLGLEEEAVRCWQEALQADPAHLEANFNYGYYRWQRAEVLGSEFLKQLQGLEATHGSNPEYWRLLAWVYLEQGYVEEVEEILEKRGVKDEALRRAHTAPDRPVGREVHCFKGHTGVVNSVAFSPDGRYALSGSSDGTVRLWDVASGKEVRKVQGYDELVSEVAFLANGQIIMARSKDGAILWDTRTDEVHRYKGGNLEFFDESERYALATCEDGSVRLWDVTTKQEVRRFGRHDGTVYSATFSPDKNHVLSGGGDNILRLWEVETGKEVRHFVGHSHWVFSVTFSPDGEYVLSGSGDQTVRIWEVKTGRELRCFRHEGAVFSVAFSPNGRYALSSSHDRTIRVWEVYYPSFQLTSIKMHPFPVIAQFRAINQLQQEDVLFAELLRMGQQHVKEKSFLRAHDILRQAQDVPGYERNKDVLQFLTLCRVQGGGYCRNIRNGWCVYCLDEHTDSIASVAFSPDGRYALSGGGDRVIRLWEIENGRVICKLEGHTLAVYSVVFSPDGHYALSGSWDKTIRLWEVATGREVNRFDRHVNFVNSVAFSPDGRYIISAGWDETIRLWDTTTGHEMYCLKDTDVIWSVCFSPDGLYILSGSEDGSVKLWDIKTREVIHRFTGLSDRIHCVAFSPDGRYALSGSSGGMVMIWDVGTRRVVHQLSVNNRWVTPTTFSPDGRYILIGSDDGTLQLVNTQEGNAARVFKGHTDWVFSIAISIDGQYALSGSKDQTIRVWALDWDYDFPDPADWDEGARPYLDIFLTLHTPYGRDGLSRVGKPQWTEKDFQKLLQELGYRGYGWLRPEGVRRELEKMAKERS
jgi:WD40 repeat protein/serine/threonine protein kinase